MDIYDIREQNYRLLLVAFSQKLMDELGTDHGLLDKFAKFTDTSPRYLSHVNSGRKKLGDESCRKFESAHKLPHGWMDQTHSKPTGDKEREAVDMFVNLYRAAPLEVQALLMRYMADKTLNRAATAQSPVAKPERQAKADTVKKATRTVSKPPAARKQGASRA
jgi:hypothetical protein